MAVHDEHRKFMSLSDYRDALYVASSTTLRCLDVLGYNSYISGIPLIALELRDTLMGLVCAAVSLFSVSLLMSLQGLYRFLLFDDIIRQNLVVM